MEKPFVMLSLAIVFEMVGTTCLAASQGFARWLPAAGSLVHTVLRFTSCLSRLKPCRLVFSMPFGPVRAWC